ncbi:MAG: ABC transporter ATP-binding protein/permease [Lachnospiraceae bacterium]|nr:ABC transporter ATP-binding protein/permease [Lachnospiraceae bacterium]
MLEVRNLCKTYRSSDGVSVEATKNISIRFPERGMVFLLGRSGSGKSTLLHLLGGLDRYDSGDILIHNTSTKDFTAAMMDSYRNTYIGFIFQDYNILPEFTVGGNIALALEMQGMRASGSKIRELLEEVDLKGFARRKPNELSGGQLQRVAIARAIIKDPDIILADEPTGALDSETGRAVFETLKKLSKTKLVIIVSHDREYSEQYADRIIELADGCVVSDTELKPVQELKSVREVEFDDYGVRVDKKGVVVDAGCKIAPEDLDKVNYYLELQSDNNVLITDGNRLSPKRDRFRGTDEFRIVPEKKEFKLIKSKLPWKRSFGIGLNSMLNRKLALFFMVFLSVVAFTLFGVSDVFVSYDRLTCMTDTIYGSESSFLTIVKEPDYRNFREDFSYAFSDEEIQEIDNAVDTPLVKISRREGSFSSSFMFYRFDDETDSRTDMFIYPMYGVTVLEATPEVLDALGVKLRCGRLPEAGSTEVVISQIAARGVQKHGDAKYRGKSFEEMLGMKLKTIQMSGTNQESDCTVVGIVDVPVDYERYERLFEKPDEELSESERILHYVLQTVAQSECAQGVPSFVYCGVGSKSLVTSDALLSFYVEDDARWDMILDPDGEQRTELEIYQFGDYAKMRGAKAVRLDDGTDRAPADDEVYITGELMSTIARMFLPQELRESYDPKTFDPGNLSGNYGETLAKYADRVKIVNPKTGAEYRIAGYITIDNKQKAPAGGVFVVSSKVAAGLDAIDFSKNVRTIVCRMPEDRSTIENIAKMTIEKRNGAYVSVNPELTYMIGEFDEISRVMYPVLFWIGVVFAVFSAVLFAVFIANSIIHKKTEIGVLRAIGARGLDVYRIFLCETGVIALINAALSSLMTKVFADRINTEIEGDLFYKIKVVHFGARQVLIIAAIAAAVAIVATFIPISRFARRKPIDVIRDR